MTAIMNVPVVLTFVLFIVDMSGRAEGQMYGLTVNRVPTIDSNEIRLECVANVAVGLQGSVVFFRNGEIVRETSENMYNFFVNRQNEGNYSCGERVGTTIHRDDPPFNVPLLPYPEDNDGSEPKQFSFNIGSQAILNCSVVPGSLFNYYSVVWRNASTLELLYVNNRQEQSRSSNRYSLDNRTFSLLIDNVQPSDTTSPYLCEVRVHMGSASILYPNTLRTNLTLNVFEAPAFIEFPVSRTIPAGGKTNASFSCAVRSSPGSSSIVWLHQTNNRMERISENSSHYLLQHSRIETVGGFQVRSELTVVGVDNGDMGDIICKASYNDFPDISPSTQKTTLTVLNAPSELGVRYLDDGDILYEVYLHRPLLVPVRVALSFINMETGVEDRSLRPNEYFYNTSIVRLFREKPPFSGAKFRLQASIVFGDDEIQGPFLKDPEVFGGQRKNLNLEFIVCAALCVLLVIALVLVILVACCLVLRSQRMSNLMEKAMKTGCDGSCQRPMHSNGKLSGGATPQNGLEGDGIGSTPVFMEAFLCCKRKSTYCREKGLTPHMADVYVKNIEKILTFGLRDATVKPKLDSEKREALWPLMTSPEHEYDSTT